MLARCRFSYLDSILTYAKVSSLNTEFHKTADGVELSQPALSFSRHPKEKLLQPRTGALLAVLELVAEVEEGRWWW